MDVGCYEAWYKAISTVYQDEGHQMDVVEAVKKTVSIPVLGQGKMFDPEKAEKPGKKVVVIGGGLVGCETAVYMKESAEEVIIVEMLGDILAIADHCLNNDQALRALVKERNIGIIADAKVLKLTPNSVSYTKDEKENTIECDTVIVAAGFLPNNELEEALDKKVKDLTVIGDAEAPRKIISAVHEGYHTIRVM